MPNRPRSAPAPLRAAAGAGAFCVVLGLGVAPAPALADDTTSRRFEGSNCQLAGSSEAVTTTPTSPWWQARLHYDDLARAGATGEGIKIAVIDTGVDRSGSAFLSEKNVPVVEDFAPPARDKDQVTFDCFHGTAVVGLLVGDPEARAGQGNQEAGAGDVEIRGIAPGATVYALRALASSGPTQPPQPIAPVVAAIRRAIELQVDIINISQEAGQPPPDYATAVQEALAAGIVVVAAAGNGGPGAMSYPAAYPGVISVGMSTRGDIAAAASGSHPEMPVTIGAPGADMITLLPSEWPRHEQYYQVGAEGTSFAAPLVAGTVALMLQRERMESDDPARRPILPSAEVARRLQATADVPGRAAPDPQLGAGIVNPWRAVMGATGAAPAGPSTPSPTPAAEASPAAVEGPRPPAPQPKRDLALAILGGATALVLGGGVLAASLPAARRRRSR